MGSAPEGERGYAVRSHTGAETQAAAACVLSGSKPYGHPVRIV